MSEESLGILIGNAAVKGASPVVVKEFMDKVVSPFIKGVGGRGVDKKIKASLARYLRYLENSTRSVFTFAKSSGGISFDDLYEPMTISSRVSGSGFSVDGYPVKVFEEARCVSLTDDAGMGKSTIAKYVARRAVYEQRSIPLLIELRKIRKGKGIVRGLCEDLMGGVEESSLRKLFGQGNFVFILDGFDEIEESLRSSVAEEINDMQSRFQFCYFFLTSRPEYSSSLFPSFTEFSVDKLTRASAESLIRRCDEGRGVAPILISKIDDAGVSDFLGNPLLVTLLYRAFDYRKSIPPKRIIFFRQVYDALFQDHDLSKGDAYSRKKESGLDCEDFHKLMRCVGFETFRSGRISYSTEEFMAHVDNAKSRAGFEIESSKVLRDVLKAVPIFHRDGVEVRWAHKSLQEYFAASFINFDMVDRRGEAIDRMFRSMDCLRYGEVFRFLSEMNVDLVRAVCVKPFLDEIAAEYPGVDFGIASVHFSVDIYYFKSNMFEGDEVAFDSMSVALSQRFDSSLGNRLTAISSDAGSGFDFLGVMKDRGKRMLLLSFIDKGLFPRYHAGIRHSANIKSLASFLGNDDLYLNPDIDYFCDLVGKYGSLDVFESAALIFSISQSARQAVDDSLARIERISKDDVLAGF